MYTVLSVDQLILELALPVVGDMFTLAVVGLRLSSGGVETEQWRGETEQWWG